MRAPGSGGHCEGGVGKGGEEEGSSEDGRGLGGDMVWEVWEKQAGERVGGAGTGLYLSFCAGVVSLKRATKFL